MTELWPEPKFKSNAEKLCPICQHNNENTKLKLYQINLTTAVYVCEKKSCLYPSGYGWIFVDRNIDNLDDSDLEDNVTKSDEQASISVTYTQIDHNNIARTTVDDNIDLLEELNNIISEESTKKKCDGKNKSKAFSESINTNHDLNLDDLELLDAFLDKPESNKNDHDLQFDQIFSESMNLVDETFFDNITEKTDCTLVENSIKMDKPNCLYIDEINIGNTKNNIQILENIQLVPPSYINNIKDIEKQKINSDKNMLTDISYTSGIIKENGKNELDENVKESTIQNSIEGHINQCVEDVCDLENEKVELQSDSLDEYKTYNSRTKMNKYVIDPNIQNCTRTAALKHTDKLDTKQRSCLNLLKVFSVSKKNIQNKPVVQNTKHFLEPKTSSQISDVPLEDNVVESKSFEAFSFS